MKKKWISRLLAVVLSTTMFLPAVSVRAEDNGEYTTSGEEAGNDADTFYIENDESGIPDRILYDIVLTDADTNGDKRLSVEEAEALTTIAISPKACQLSLKGISKLKNLQNFYVYPISELTLEDTDELCELKELNAIVMGHLTAETQLPDFGVLPKLKNFTLYASDMKYSYYGNLKTLESLSLWGAGYKELPNGIESLDKIESLDLNNNYFTDVSFLTKFPNLKSINLLMNPVSTLPDLTNFDLDTRCNFTYTKITAEEARKKLPASLVNNKEWWDKQGFIEKSDEEIAEDKLVEELGEAEKGSTVEAELTNSKVSQKVLTALQGKDITLSLSGNSGQTKWNILGTNLPEGTLTDIDLSVARKDKENGNITESVIDELAGNRTAEQLIFGTNEDVTFKPQLALTVNSDNTAEKGVLLQKSGDALMLAANSLIKDNAVAFTLNQKADSVIVYGTNGDIDGDNKVKIKDAMQILQHTNSRKAMNELQKGFADTDSNNKVNLQDVMREMHYISGRNKVVY